jgi:hypothetical protein
VLSVLWQRPPDLQRRAAWLGPALTCVLAAIGGLALLSLLLVPMVGESVAAAVQRICTRAGCRSVSAAAASQPRVLTPAAAVTTLVRAFLQARTRFLLRSQSGLP